MRKHAIISLINIGGLSVAMACCILFSTYVINEYSFDAYHEDADRIYRLIEWNDGVRNVETGGNPYGGMPAGPKLQEDFRDVEAFTRVQKTYDEKFLRADNKVYRNAIAFSDPQLFNIFTFHWLNGNQGTALKDDHDIVLTRSMAYRLFGKTNIVGQEIEIRVEDRFEPFTVSGVIDDIPSNSSLKFDIVAHINKILSTEFGKESANHWDMNMGVETFVKLRSGSMLPYNADALARLRREGFPDEANDLKAKGIWNGKGSFPVKFKLQPLLDIHTDSKVSGGVNTANIWILVYIAAGILLIACINFTTLAMGRSAGRSREVGVRKVLGANRRFIFMQFLIDAIILSAASCMLGLVLSWFFIPYFDSLTGANFDLPWSRIPQLILLVCLFAVVTGVLAGVYPAIKFSSIREIDSLNNKFRLGGGNFFSRVLVTGQFILSVSLVFATVVLIKQVRFMKKGDTGFSRDRLVMVNVEGQDAKKIYPVFRRNLIAGTAVAGVTASELGLGEGMGVAVTAVEHESEKKGVVVYPVDVNFLDVLQMHLVGGRNFNSALASDSLESIIVNESFLKAFGLKKEKVLGLQVKDIMNGQRRTIIGVIENFHFSHFREAINPQMFIHSGSFSPNKIFIRLAGVETRIAMDKVEKDWNALKTGLPLQYDFVDDTYNRFYKDETSWFKIIGAAGIISIILACSGLFGLTMLSVKSREKEIGIRKVLGASIPKIFALLSRDHLVLVLVALLIALPLSSAVMTRWLTNYAYRIDIDAWLFAIVGVVTVGISLATISVQVISAARANPVDSIKRM